VRQPSVSAGMRARREGSVGAGVSLQPSRGIHYGKPNLSPPGRGTRLQRAGEDARALAETELNP
jgi:hypothetical protein